VLSVAFEIVQEERQLPVFLPAQFKMHKTQKNNVKKVNNKAAYIYPLRLSIILLRTRQKYSSL